MKYKELTQNISGSLRTLSQDSPDLRKSFNHWNISYYPSVYVHYPQFLQDQAEMNEFYAAPSFFTACR